MDVLFQKLLDPGPCELKLHVGGLGFFEKHFLLRDFCEYFRITYVQKRR